MSFIEKLKKSFSFKQEEDEEEIVPYFQKTPEEKEDFRNQQGLSKLQLNNIVWTPMISTGIISLICFIAAVFLFIAGGVGGIIFGLVTLLIGLLGSVGFIPIMKMMRWGFFVHLRTKRTMQSSEQTRAEASRVDLNMIDESEELDQDVEL